MTAPEKAHAVLSASGAHRWMSCTPSARLEETFPEETSRYAEEGSVAHALAEAVNGYQFKAKYKKAKYNKDIAAIKLNKWYNAEMQGHIEKFRDFVAETLNAARAVSADAVVELEVRLDYSEYVPEGFGTGDVVIIADGTMTVIDLKYGQGVPVSAENNTQMMLYALGGLGVYDMLYGIEKVKMIIYQPRLDAVSEWEISAADLRVWAETELKEKAALAYDGAGEFNPGGHCRFCRARYTCRALAQENLKLARYDFKPAETLSPDEVADIMKTSERLVTWASDVKDYALKQALRGVTYPGYKVVEGRSNSEITDPVKAGEILKDMGFKFADVTNSKLKGIGDLKKLLGKDVFEEALGDLIQKPPGKPTLVQITDGRPEWSSAAADFTGVEIDN